jgi:MFS family permease
MTTLVLERTGNAPTARRDFALLWLGQSLSLFGDQFMVLALPLMAVTLLGTSPAQAELLSFALFLPFLPLSLPAGAIIERLPRRATMLVCNAVQAVVFGVIWLLGVIHALSFALLIGLVTLSGCAMVFFQVAYTSYLPNLYADADDLQRGNARLAMTESSSRMLGPMVAGPVVAVLGVLGAVAANAFSFVVSVLSLLLIRHREPPREPEVHERGWIWRNIATGMRFVFGHPMLQPILLCGTTYVLFLSMVETSLVLYCHNVLHLSPQLIGVVVGAAAAGYPFGNLLSTRLTSRLGTPRTLFFTASVSVAGVVAMPAFGTIGGVPGVVGLVLGSIVHCVAEGAYGPASLTLRQTESPPALLARVGSVQRFLMWGAVAIGGLLAAVATSLLGLTGAVWIGALGTVLCIPILLRRGVRTAVLGRA